ncbi:N-acetylglucosamine-6-phosphate deacetylase [Candidatus Phycosocius bacilliformis]|uniref:N-acetylglucosamine-6-phosphate deacetylase n=1 Tax=Candidatus Phycosocius bacilliformis TaxID=1445552 RepID=A0A2P2ED89_9PROT|nr:N-acetylglucosamine-6-phosphate deacetylase [Candidatus Phycosocius bacilliformis]GBF59032.1 N-acetylglucosamine-6-phosphate deacetylase [Candidatus Phycosocius bacilliformis]
MRQIFLNGRLLTAKGLLSDATLVVANGQIEAIGKNLPTPPDAEVIDLSGDYLAPGLLDLQVNGGGGVLFNDSPTIEAIAAIGEAHLKRGTTSFLPTLISDDLDKVATAISAVDAAIEAGIPGVAGIHLEGPFLNAMRKGVHDSRKFRVLDEAAIELLSSLRLGKTLITLAPETAPDGAIFELARRGGQVFAGHTEATYEQILLAEGEGLRGFTHIFNAMSPLTSRAPGVVGAALTSQHSFAGLIADGVHVHPANLKLVARLLGPERTVLVSDAMPTMGSAQDWFMLKGEKIEARGLTCYTPDGVLAGSNLSLLDGVRTMVSQGGASLEDALTMASLAPARAMGLMDKLGTLRAGGRADFVRLTEGGNLLGVWQGGKQRLGQ